MAYSRQPQVVLANGGALKQTPIASSQTPPGIVPVEIEALISTTNNLGVVQVGSGLNITPGGVLSATNTGSDFVNVTLTGVSYSITADDYYVGATTNNITITLPQGETGRVYYVKNQAPGNVRVQCTGSETIDGNSFKTLGTDAGFILVFDGSRWNIL